VRPIVTASLVAAAEKWLQSRVIERAQQVVTQSHLARREDMRFITEAEHVHNSCEKYLDNSKN
jgi:hypothetical protein